MKQSPTDLLSWLSARGGVAHTSTLRDAGHSTHAIRRALASGDIEWLRRSWLATRTCDSELARAATVGGRLTCVTVARRLGLWTPDAGRLHIVVPPTSSRHEAAGIQLHWAVGPAPVGMRALEDPVINALFHVARCLPLPQAAAVWESAIRSRRVDAAVLRGVRWHSAAASRLAAQASSLSDSGIETAFAVLMRGIGVPIRQQYRIDGHRVDALVGHSLVVQLDGFAHHQAAQRRRDLRADARLVLRGFTVLRFDYQQVLFDPAYVIDTVSAAIAQGHHLAQ